MLPTCTIKCRGCGNDFISERGRKIGRYLCSVACRAKYQRRKRHPERFAVRKCECCGSDYVPSLKSTTTQKACSRLCMRRLNYRKNKQKLDEYRKQWSKDNRSKQRQYYITSASKRPEHYREVKRIAENRRRLLIAGGPTHTPQQWLELREKHRFTCLCCGEKEPMIELTEDHVVPLSAGGTDAIENIQPLCRKCNSHKGARVMDFRQ
jgi:5-methylcytosine-specific restriction endonuclease McrA